VSRFNTISFLSDFGTADEFVGVVHSVIRSIAPEVTVIDITHNIEPFDVRAGSLALARAAAYFVPGVVLGVVDPGVGTSRRPIIIEVGDGQSYLVGPDNGLFAPIVSLVGGATAAWRIDNQDYLFESPGATFDGRDVFAPVAAHLCGGIEPGKLGSPVEPASLVPGILPVSEQGSDGTIEADVFWVDRFGNVQLNVDPTQLDDWPSFVTITTSSRDETVTRVDSYASLGAGLGLLVDSQGLMALVANSSSAAEELGLREGDRVTLSRAEHGPANSVATPVTLSQRPTVTNPNDVGVQPQ